MDPRVNAQQRRRSHQELVDGVCRLAPRGSPRPRAIGRAACRRPRTPSDVAAVGERIGLDVAALVELEAERLEHAVVLGMHEAHGEQDEIGVELELGAGDRLELRIHAHAVRLLHLAVFAREFRRQHGEVARDALLVARRRAQLQRPVRASRRGLFSASGGCGMISKFVTESAPWRIEVPMQSEPVSPPPMTTTCLPPARIGSPGAARRSPGGSAAAGTPWRNGCP